MDPARYEYGLIMPDPTGESEAIVETYFFPHRPTFAEIKELGARGLIFQNIVRPGDKVDTFFVMDPDGSLVLGTEPYSITVSEMPLPELLLD